MREYMQYIDCECQVCEEVHNEGNKENPQVGFEIILVLEHNPRFAKWYDDFYTKKAS